MSNYVAAERAWSTAVGKHDNGEYEFVACDMNADGQALNEYHIAEIDKARGRQRSTLGDAEVVPEQAPLAVLNDQVRAVRGPVLLLVLSAFVSTAGGLLSIG